MWIRTIALALLIGAPLASGAEPRTFSPWGAIETSTQSLTGPLIEGGMLLAKACPACTSVPLRLNADTLLFIGKRQVTLVEFNKFLEGGGSHGLAIAYDKTQHTVIQVAIFPNLAPRPANAGR